MRIVWSAQAQQELLDIADFYDRIDPVLANDLVSRVETATLPLIDFPGVGQVVGHEGARKWRVAGTPFLLFYDVTDSAVNIVGVGHVRTKWRDER